MAKNVDKNSILRLAIVNEDKCKPTKCNLECKKACPVNRIGKKCIEVGKTADISETLCIGCGMCEKKCPFGAITIINLPTNLTKDCSHRYGANSFKLHRLPVPKPGKVLGLVGINGIGKSTALKILSGKLKPNLGEFENEPEWSDVLKNYRGSELHGFFTKLLEGKLVPSNKIQYIDKIPKLLSKMFNEKDLTVRQVLDKMDGRNMKEYYTEKFELKNLLDRNLINLSGGELQRFSIAVACLKDANVYIFDEPTSFLDVKQRLTAAKEIRKLCEKDNSFVIVVEHDLAVLDLLSDYGCVLYGQSGCYGVISAPFSIKSAINIFLDGYIPTENMRFRPSALKFNIQEVDEATKVNKKQFAYAGCTKTFAGQEFSKLQKSEISLSESITSLSLKAPSFKLEIEAGTYSNSEITVFLGENGMGKSTFVNLIAGIYKDDAGNLLSEGNTVSLKPQKIAPKFKGTVRELISLKLKGRFSNPEFQIEIVKPLNIEYLLDNEISGLSGGELQRVAIVICLGKEADIYLLDEPAAFLDSDQRIAISKLIRKYIYTHNKTAFIVEHDLIVSTYLADRVVVFEGIPGISSKSSIPLPVREGMNLFLKHLDITFRRDPTNYRPRINKPESSKD